MAPVHSPSRSAEAAEVPSSAGLAAPKRIQLSRKAGWRMPPNTVKVDRTTKWGNPFTVSWVEISGKAGTTTVYRVEDVEHVFNTWYGAISASVEKFRARLEHPSMATARANLRAELAGKNLACWCKPDQPCHADVLLELASNPA